MEAYAAYYDSPVRDISSSGGVFSVIASEFDVVYGVAMSEDCYSCDFIRVEGDISRLRGSKYLQAKMGDTFKHVEQDLESGKMVLFAGTGCQVNGLSLFLGKDYSNLFLLDIICHGVPSPFLWKKYVVSQEKRYKQKITDVNFRCKDNGWKNFGLKENQMYSSKGENPYMKMFLRNYCLRPSCYECHAKSYKKADMSIGDFWGIDKVLPSMNDNRGVSVIITRSDKGKKLLERITCKMIIQNVNYEEAVKYNPAEHISVERPKLRSSFFNDLASKPFQEIEKKYARVDNSYKKLFKRIFKKIIRMCRKHS